MLELDWSAAAGASAYAIFQSESATGPFDLLAVVAGHDHTSIDPLQQLPPGRTTYFVVVALHPCTDASTGVTCDGAPAAYGGPRTASVAWTKLGLVQGIAYSVASA